MIANEAIATIAALHRRLADLLADLEQAGRTVAAAHLVAAIDVLEAELDGRDTPPFAHEAGDGVARLASGMRDAFGARAERVARGQLAGADGLARFAWAAIVQRLAAA